MRWYILGGIAIVALVVVFGSRSRLAETRLALERATLPPASPASKFPTTSTAPLPPKAATATAPVVVPSVNFDVPFISQAPFGNWDPVHEETCEEASIAMADAFFDGRTFTPQTAEDELQALIAWQKNRFGYFESTTAEETTMVLKEYYGRRAEVRTEVTVEAIKKELAAGNLVIVPAYGRGLNPFFKQPGPLYHMLLIKGYTANRFITNDPGTRRGADYPYAFDKLLSHVHDWNGGDVESGRKVMIVVYP